MYSRGPALGHRQRPRDRTGSPRGAASTARSTSSIRGMSRSALGREETQRDVQRLGAHRAAAPSRSSALACQSAIRPRDVVGQVERDEQARLWARRSSLAHLGHATRRGGAKGAHCANLKIVATQSQALAQADRGLERRVARVAADEHLGAARARPASGARRRPSRRTARRSSVEAHAPASGPAASYDPLEPGERLRRLRRRPACDGSDR